MDEEVWKPVVGYEGLYEVSSKGRVRSLPFKHSNCKVLKLTQRNNGYLFLTLSKNRVQKPHSVHRLVAMAFIPNPDNKPTVNHKNEIRTDNRVENLEWATYYEQNHYGTHLQKAKSSLKRTYNTPQMKEMLSLRQKKNKSGAACGKRIVQLDKSFNFVNTWNSITQAATTLCISQSSISMCLTGKTTSSHGYLWIYFKDYKLWKEKYCLKQNV